MMKAFIDNKKHREQQIFIRYLPLKYKYCDMLASCLKKKSNITDTAQVLWVPARWALFSFIFSLFLLHPLFISEEWRLQALKRFCFLHSDYSSLFMCCISQGGWQVSPLDCLILGLTCMVRTLEDKDQMNQGGWGKAFRQKERLQQKPRSTAWRELAKVLDGWGHSSESRGGKRWSLRSRPPVHLWWLPKAPPTYLSPSPRPSLPPLPALVCASWRPQRSFCGCPCPCLLPPPDRWLPEGGTCNWFIHILAPSMGEAHVSSRSIIDRGVAGERVKATTGTTAQTSPRSSLVPWSSRKEGDSKNFLQR